MRRPFDAWRLAAALLLAGAGPRGLAADEESIAPFTAHYTAEWRSITVGTSDIELRTGPSPGQFLYTWTMTARGIFRLVYNNDVVQKSWISLQGGHVRPDRYRAEQGDSSLEIAFDWSRRPRPRPGGGKAHRPEAPRRYPGHHCPSRSRPCWI